MADTICRPWAGSKNERNGVLQKKLFSLLLAAIMLTSCAAFAEGISDESMKYVGMSEGGRLIVCYCDDNLVKKDGDVAFAYIFVRAE